MNLHSGIMNIQIDRVRMLDQLNFVSDYNTAYKLGNRDARRAAAELSLKAEARIDELEEVLKAFVNWERTQHIESLFDDHELWKRAEQVLK